MKKILFIILSVFVLAAIPAQGGKKSAEGPSLATLQVSAAGPRRLSVLLNSLDKQDMKARIIADPDVAGGYFYHYTASDNSVSLRAPKGYKPFYISHFGRHGCRHHSAESIYRHCLEALQKGERAQVLTASGKALLAKMEIISEDVMDCYGDLTPRGKKEHRGIAERMYENYPEVFKAKKGQDVQIISKSTVVPRCILSMTAFNERLKELDPSLKITNIASRRYMRELTGIPLAKEADIYSQVRVTVDSLRREWVNPQRFISSIFSDAEFVRKEIHHPEVLMYEMFLVAVIQQDTDYLNQSLYDAFTNDELYTLWTVLNMQGYCTMSPSSRFGGPIVSGVEPILEEIITTADKVISGELKVAATLRFGHDSGLIPLFSLMGLKDIALDLPFDEVAEKWNLSDISPMASNLQMIFYRNKKGLIKVRVLRNEKDALLPLDGPFYDWNELRNYLVNCYSH